MALRPMLVLSVSMLALTAASCGTPAPPVAQESASISETLPLVEEVSTLPDVADLRLSVDDALLHGTDAPAPWDLSHRNIQAFPHDIGANQTDCGPYWEYERLGRLQGGETMWWRDGGNLNNMVRRETEPGEAARLMGVFADLPQTCGVTSWSEGDSFTIEPLDLSDTPGTDGLLAVSIDHARTDEVVWLAFAQRGDLISELRVTMWPESESGQIPAFSRSDFAAVASTMAARLELAGADDAPPTTAATTTPTVPGQRPDETATTPTVPGQRPDETAPTLPPDRLEDEMPELEPLPPDPAIPPIDIPPPTTAPLGGLASGLLVSDELPDGWTADRATEYETGDSEDDEPLAGCPASAIIVELETRFEYSTDLTAPGAENWESYGMQFIAELSEGEDGTEFASLFLALDGCEGSDQYSSYVLSADAVEVVGADAGVVVYVDQTRQISVAGESDGSLESERFVLAVATVGSTFTAFSVSTEAPVLDFLQRAVDKIIASGPF